MEDLIKENSKVNESNNEVNKDNVETVISYPPHIWSGFSTSKIMYILLSVLLLPTIAAVYFFGIRAFWVIFSSTTTAILVEFLIKKLRKKKFIMDGSAAITGLLLALTLPPRIPIWMVVLGSAFAIALAKEAFGGLGYNIFNPALAGRAFLAISFSSEMTKWYLPRNFSADAVTSATPLSESYVFEGTKSSLYKDLFLGNVGGSIGETSAILILVACLILIIFKIIDWKIPLIYVGTVAVASFVFGEDVLFQVLVGGLLFGAVFMATDYVTSPITGLGKVIFAVGCGIITFIIRRYGAMPEGVCFSILIMNGFVPLIDKYVRPKPFGYVKASKKSK